MFWTQGLQGSALGFLTRRWYLTQAGVTGVVTGTAQVEIAGTMQPTMSGRTRADFTVDLLLADPFFYSAPQTVRIPNFQTGNIVNLGDGAIGFGQAPGNGGVPFTIKLTGPLSGPLTLANDTIGVSLTVNTGVAAGHFVTLDVMNYTAYTDAGVSYLGNISHAGARPWMLLMPAGPNSALVNQLVFYSGNSADQGYCDVTYSYPYL